MSQSAALAPQHPLLACAEQIEAALKDVSDVDPLFMSVTDKAEALVRLNRLAGQVEALGLRVLAVAEDVAERDAARDAGTWLAHQVRLDFRSGRRAARLAVALERRWPAVGEALRTGRVNPAQAEAIVAALDQLPADLDPEVKTNAGDHLVEQAREFNPRALRILGRRILHVVAPEVAEDHERRKLEEEEREAAKKAFVRWWRRSDGTTDFRIRLADAAANRLISYLDAFISPRRRATATEAPCGQPTAQPTAEPTAGSEQSDQTDQPEAEDQGPSCSHNDSGSHQPDDRRSYAQSLAHALTSFLEAVDAARLPLHGGGATTIMVTIDLDTLRDQLGNHGVALVGDEPISAAQARRLACTAGLIPVVLGGKSEVLDLGRTSRLFKPHQRKAMALRTATCEVEGCDIPAAWCEAHHLNPWAAGGNTDLADGVLICPYHHHRAHDPHYDMRHTPTGRYTFHRRT